MSAMSSPLRRQRLALIGLLLLGIVGFVLVVTAPGEGPPLASVITEEGLVTEVPDGWERSEQFGFQFHPPTGLAEVFDRWTVARSCGPDGCEKRSLDEWLKVAVTLPTFIQALAPDSELQIIEDETGADYRTMVTRTSAGGAIVFVAAFDDGRDFYVECGLALSPGGDTRLIDEIVDVCRATETVSV